MITELTAMDRCDGCGAPAKVIATKQEEQLLLCGHHANLHKKVLIKKKWKLTGEQQ